MSAAAALARIEAAGGKVALRPDGRVVIRNASRLSPGLVGEARQHRENMARLLAERASASFLLRAAEDALAALVGPELGPVLQIGQVDHDEAEREALAAVYAVVDPRPPPQEAYCFPCGKPAMRADRRWSDAKGWCCASCHSEAVAQAAVLRHKVDREGKWP